MATKSGYVAASFYDPATGTVVQINEENLERLDFNQSELEPDQSDPTGGHPFVGHLSELELETWDFSGISQLQEWARSDARISMVAAGVEQNIQWYETDRVSVSLNPKSEAGQANTYIVRMRREGHGVHDIYNDVNLLNPYGWRGSDDDSDNVPDAYTSSLSLPAWNDSDGDGVKERFGGFGATDGGKYTLGRDVVFPVAGHTLTLSTSIGVLHEDGDTGIEIVARNRGGSALQTQLQTFDATGRHSTSIELPPFTYEVTARPVIVQSVTTQATKVQIADPALRIDGSTRFAQH